MRVTGVVRKIDELGRIVIPKEIRRNLKINEGTPLEIFVNNDELVFKKFSPLFELNQLVEYCAQSIAETFDLPFLIFDMEQCLATNKLNKKEYLHKTLSPEIQKIIKKKNCLIKTILFLKIIHTYQ